MLKNYTVAFKFVPEHARYRHIEKSSKKNIQESSSNFPFNKFAVSNRFAFLKSPESEGIFSIRGKPESSIKKSMNISKRSWL